MKAYRQQTRGVGYHMKLIIIIVIITLIVIGFIGIRSLSKSTPLDTDGGFASLEDLPRLVEKIKSEGGNGSFWVVLVPETAGNDGYSANLQVSIANNTIGLDWVLIAERNIKDKSKFHSIIAEHGLEAKALSGNGVNYIRVEDSKDFPGLSKDILERIYGVNESTRMNLIITGFTWP